MLTAESLKPSVIGLGCTLLDAIKALNGPAEGLAIVVDTENRVAGVLTDGDVRRALLKEARLDAPAGPYICRDFLFATESESRDQAFDLMQTKKVRHLPILDACGRLLGIHMMYDVVGAEKLPNCAVIMAGGRGVRLRPLTDNIPKPMLKVAGRPILERLVLHLVGCGITKIFLSVNYMADVIEKHFQDGKRFGCEITYLREERQMGTGGALGLLPSAPKDPIVVLNGDIVSQIDFVGMIDFHKRNNFAATIGTRPYTHQIPFGCLDVDGSQVLNLEEKPIIEKCVNAGVYVLSSEALSLVPQGEFPMTSLFQAILERGGAVGSYEITSEWTDIGQHSELNRARGEC
jgi:dTDP-glucose pyrophosphorylase